LGNETGWRLAAGTQPALTAKRLRVGPGCAGRRSRDSVSRSRAELLETGRATVRSIVPDDLGPPVCRPVPWGGRRASRIGCGRKKVVFLPPSLVRSRRFRERGTTGDLGLAESPGATPFFHRADLAGLGPRAFRVEMFERAAPPCSRSTASLIATGVRCRSGGRGKAAQAIGSAT